MKVVLSMSVALVLMVLSIGYQAEAQDKEATLKGTILCARCALKETKKCTTAILVKEKEKDVVYYFDDRGTKEEYHEAVCGGDRKAGLVTGQISKKDGKNWIRPSKVKYSEK